MWKCASRSFRSIFCKNQSCHNNVTSREARYNRNCNRLLNFSPTLLGHFKRSYGNENQSKFSKNDSRENPKTDRHYCLNDLHNGIVDTLRWSGIFVLGWYFLQPFSHRRALFSHQPSEKCAFTILRQYTRNEYLKLVDYLKRSIEPFHYVLPKVQAKNSKKKGVSSNDDCSIKSELDDSNYEELERAHHKVLGALSNTLGAQCMKHGNYSEAIRHFEDGAQLHNPSSLYNLGVCHESGLGTDQDFKKAAELYKKASDLGHPAATYNLGVFYVHGVGDLKPDINEARKLFTVAASQGQPNAKEALDLENNIKQVCENKVAMPENQVNNLQEDNCTNKLNKESGEYENMDIYRLLNIKIETNFDDKLCDNDDSGALDLSPSIQEITVSEKFKIEVRKFGTLKENSNFF